MRRSLMLRYVEVDGQLRDVREFRGIPRAQRPIARCPECHEQVTLRLGAVRQAHAAHRKGAVCPTTQGETALHRATKFHIAKQLEGRRFVTVETRCDGVGDFAFTPMGRCEESWKWKLAKHWNRVEMEYQCEGFRPDIALLRNDEIIAAIEVAVHHRTDARKAEWYLESEIPWVEIEATEELIAADSGWTIFEPLPALWDHQGFSWRCDACSDLRSNRCFDAPDAEVVAWRIVDFYFPSGKTWRDRIDIRRVPEGEAFAATVICQASDHLDGAKLYEGFEEDMIDFLKSEVQTNWEIKSDNGVIVDSPMDWQESADPPHWRDFESYPRRYRRDRSGTQWFLPAEGRRLRWSERVTFDSGES